MSFFIFPNHVSGLVNSYLLRRICSRQLHGLLDSCDELHCALESVPDEGMRVVDARRGRATSSPASRLYLSQARAPWRVPRSSHCHVARRSSCTQAPCTWATSSWLSSALEPSRTWRPWAACRVLLGRTRRPGARGARSRSRHGSRSESRRRTLQWRTRSQSGCWTCRGPPWCAVPSPGLSPVFDGLSKEVYARTSMGLVCVRASPLKWRGKNGGHG
jgi:hypothetical protein